MTRSVALFERPGGQNRHPRPAVLRRGFGTGGKGYPLRTFGFAFIRVPLCGPLSPRVVGVSALLAERGRLEISERRACRVLGRHRSTQRRVSHPRADEKHRVADRIGWARPQVRYGDRRPAARRRLADPRQEDRAPVAARGAEGVCPTPETESAVARRRLRCPAPCRAGEPRRVVRFRASPDRGRPGLPQAQRAGRVPPRELGHPDRTQALFERCRRRAERSVFPAGPAGHHPFRPRPGVRRQDRAAMDLCSRRPHGLHPAGIPLGERIHRELPRTTARRAPERTDLLHLEGGSASHRILAPPQPRRAPAQQPGIPTSSPGNNHARPAGLAEKLPMHEHSHWTSRWE